MGVPLNDIDLLVRFGAALVVGILVGLQREFASDDPGLEIAAGVRTFALLGTVGFCAALLSDLAKAPAIFAAVFAVLGVLFAIGYFLDASKGSPGLTTKVSAVLTVLIGALAYYNRLILVAAAGVAATALLSFKGEMHRFARHITRDDLFAILKFVAISAVILPVLPDRNYGPPPIDVLNPFKIWLFVVLVSGISFIGYGLIKWAGSEKGLELTGLLGGLVSSTAVTIGLSRQSRRMPKLARPMAFAVLTAWAIMFLRVLVIVLIIDRRLIPWIWKPMTAAAVFGFLYCLYLLRLQRSEKTGRHVRLSNPFELGTAIKFGAVFTLILIFSKAAQIRFGNPGIYLSSFISGFADVDAVVLVITRLILNAEELSMRAASNAIVLGAVANTLFKEAIVLTGGTAGLRRAVLPGFLLMTAACLIAAFLF
jgi:uncharacterized membrane protein (DUF4010 family)